MIEHIFEPPSVDDAMLLAIVVRRSFHLERDSNNRGVHFITGADEALQVGAITHPAGHVVAPHIHLTAPRWTRRTQEVLIVRRGRIRANFYTDRGRQVCSRIIEAGDLIILVSGGHGFEMLEEAEMFEVKNGPYLGEADKRRFGA